MNKLLYEKRIAELELELKSLRAESNPVLGLTERSVKKPDLRKNEHMSTFSDEYEIKFKTLFSLSPDPVFIVEVGTGIILDINKKVESVYEFSREELLGKLNTLVSAEPAETKEKTKNPEHFIPLRYHKKKSGKIFPVEITASVIDLHGKKVIIANIHDITRQIRSALELEESNQRFSTIADNMPGCLAFINAKTLRYEYVNQGYANAFSIPEDRIPGMLVKEVIGEITFKKNKKYFNEVKKGNHVTFENEFDFAIGHKWMVINFVPVLDSKSVVTSFVVLGYDITERKLCEQRQKESEEKYRSIIENANVGIGVSKGVTAISANLKLQEILGYNESEIRGRSFIEFFHPDDKQIVTERICKRKAGEELPENMQARFLRKNGEIRYADVATSAFHVNNEEYYQAVFIDITDKTIAEQLLKKSEQKFRAIIETTTQGYCAINGRGNILEVNSAYSGIIGYSKDELLKMSVSDLDASMNNSETRELFQNVFSGKSLCFETVHKRKDGSYVNLEVRASRFQEGEIQSVAFVHDITERIQAENDLKFNASALSRLNRFAMELSNLPFDDNLEEIIAKNLKEIAGADAAMYSHYDPVTRMITSKHFDIDPGLLNRLIFILGGQGLKINLEITDEMYKVMTSEVVGIRKTIYDISFGKISRPVASALNAVLNVDRFIGISYVAEERLYGISLISMSKNQPDPPREILLYFAHLAAASLQRRESEKALSGSETKFRSLITNIPGAVYHRRVASPRMIENFTSKETDSPNDENDIVLLKEISIDYFSERVEAITGYNSKSFVNNEIRFGDLMHPDDRRQASTALFQGIRDSKEYFLQYRLKHKDGSWRWISERGNSYFSDNNNLLELDGIIFDMSDRKNIEVELEDYAFANQELKQFAYTASHQLQEPIRTVSNFTKIIEEDYSEKLGETGCLYLQTIRDATQRMAFLIDSLLEFSQLGRFKRLVKTDCKKLIDNVLFDLGYLITSTGAVINVYKMPELSLYEIEIRQLFYNLISNAVKFRKKGKHSVISIRSEKMNGKWKFSVSDNGIGIAHEHFEKIFDIFQRLHVDESEYEGKGIGLAYCKKIVQLHQGEMWVESIVGKGSTFYFTLADL
jgi:PAS domain S-box-containing protein